MTSEQELEEEYRTASSEAIKRVMAGFAYQGDNPKYAAETRASLAMLGKSNSRFSARNKRAEILLSAAKMVRATGPALVEVLREVAPQAPLLSAFASGPVVNASASPLATQPAVHDTADVTVDSGKGGKSGKGGARKRNGK